jgi:hypothetical protein
MGKKKHSKKKSANVKAKAVTSEPKRIFDEEIEKPHDFGGLPDRDLKKNLKC